MTLLITSAVFAVLLAFGAWEKHSNEKCLRKIPIRINVNGTRGKSTATRLITAILNEAGYNATGKTTGTAARIIYDDAEEEVVRRPRGVNISEQIKVIKKTAERNSDALVCECMAVRPEYQRTYQNQIIKAPVTVIVNVVEDHLDEMGPTLDQIAAAFAGTIPYNGTVVVPECEYTRYFLDIARERSTSAWIIHDNEVPDGYVEKFDYKLFPHNIAIGLTVAKALGISRETALRGMLKARPDPGALRFEHMSTSKTEFTVVNAFAANDPASTLEIWEKAKEQNPIVVMNCRADRADRTKQFANDCLPYIENAVLFAIGENTRDITAAYRDGKLDLAEYIDMDGAKASEVLVRMMPYLNGRTVFCIGNIHGRGQELLELFAKIL